ncbi:MAG: hypothetical protein NT127_09170, partial [Sphingobacteriales bacterium]|nr:hypothetical protein [Sphingobacteriales bacterium]
KWYCLKSGIIIQLPSESKISYSYLLSILNSSLMNFLYQDLVNEGNRIFPEVKPIQLFKLPINVVNTEKQKPFVEKADLMLSLNKDLQEQSQKFQRTLQRKFELEDLPKKLQDWYLLSYADFIKELGKLKIKLTLSQEAEWEDYFNTEATKVNAIKTQINATDKAIDAMVYELYGLSKEEIEIVENS